MGYRPRPVGPAGPATAAGPQSRRRGFPAAEAPWRRGVIRARGDVPRPRETGASSVDTDWASAIAHSSAQRPGHRASSTWRRLLSARARPPSSGVESPVFMGDVTLPLARWNKGDPHAFEELMPLVYGELRQLADHYMLRERKDHTLQPTALVHEAYLRLAGARETHFNNRVHFYGAAAQAMRRILVDHTRQRHAVRRGESRRLQWVMRPSARVSAEPWTRGRAFDARR